MVIQWVTVITMDIIITVSMGTTDIPILQKGITQISSTADYWRIQKLVEDQNCIRF